jgi:vitamin B12 transporter
MKYESIYSAIPFAMVVGATSLLSAQQRDSTRTDSISRRSRPLPPVIVTGTLTPTSARFLGGALSTIPRGLMDAEPKRIVVDQLRRAPGVYIDEQNGPLGPTVIRLRGGEEQFSQILIDGVQVNEQGGFFDASGISLVNIDRIEVARGPQSTVYGTSAMAGAVQLLSPAGVPGQNRVSATLEGARTSAQGGSRRALIEASGGSDALRYSGGVGRMFDRGVYALPNNLHSDDAAMRLDYVPAGRFELTGTARYSGVSSLLPVRDPGTSRAPLDPNSRQGRNRVLGSVDATWTANPQWTNKLTVSGYSIVFTFDNTKDQIDTTRYKIGFFDANYHYHSVVKRLTARYVSTFSSVSGKTLGWSASVGGAYENENLDTDASGDFGPSTLSLSRPSTAAFAEGEIHATDRFMLLGGARVERFRGVGTALVPRVTAAYSLVPGRVALRAAAAGAYKAPNIMDEYPDPGFFVGNPDLKPETSRSAEFGVELTGSRANATVTVFQQRFDDLIRIVPFGKDHAINDNVGRTKATGLEIDGTYRPRPRWLVGANASWTGTEVVDNRGLATDLYPNGQPLPFRPAYTTSGFVTLPIASAISATVRASAVGRQTVLSERFSGSRVSIDPYRVIDATATYAMSSVFEMYLHAQNAFNTAFYSAYDKPGAPRSVALGVRVRQ